MDRVLKFFGPTFAGLHVFAQLAMLVELGIAASWIRDNWIPATRWFWGVVLERLPLLNLELTNQEKDSLTAVAFFAPLAITSIVFRLWEEVDDNDDAAQEPARVSIYSTRFLAFLCSLAVLFIVSQQMISDAREIFAKSEAGYRHVDYFSILSIVTLGLVTITLITFYRIDREIRRYLLIFGATVGAALEMIIIGAPIILAAYVAVAELGLVRSTAIFVVTLCIVLTISFRPARMLQIAAIVVGLVVCASLWDILEDVRAEIESTRPESNQLAPPADVR